MGCVWLIGNDCGPANGHTTKGCRRFKRPMDFGRRFLYTHIILSHFGVNGYNQQSKKCNLLNIFFKTDTCAGLFYADTFFDAFIAFVFFLMNMVKCVNTAISLAIFRTVQNMRDLCRSI